MRIINNLDEMIETSRGWLADGTVSLVPIASSLHEGHKMLIQTARDISEITVVSILNKARLFDAIPDTTQAPRNLARDLRLLNTIKVDVVFIPRAEDMYPSSTFSTYVTPVGPLAERLEETSDTRSIRKFATTMTKLLQLVRPDIAFFGQKDALKVALMRQLIDDLHIDVNLRVLPTVREGDGLAVSSSNNQLSIDERQAATVIYRALYKAKALIENGIRNTHAIEIFISDFIATNPYVSLEYITICHAETFITLPEITPGTLIAIGTRIGTVQLIDNIVWMSDGEWRI